jgi:tetratricopeptide (TPR) repeat protein
MAWRRGKYADAEEHWLEATSIRRKHFGEVHYLVADSLNNLGALRRQTGDLPGAEAAWRGALDIRRKCFSGKHPAVAESLSNLAALYNDRGDAESAEPLAREALDLRLHLFDEPHAQIAESLINLAVALATKGDPEGAKALSERAVAMQRNLGSRQIGLAYALNTLAEILLDLDDPKAAEAALRESLDIETNVRTAGDWEIAFTESVLGGCLTYQGRFAEAEPLLLRSAPVIQKARGQGDLYVLNAVRRVVELYDAWEKPDEAAKYRGLLSELRNGPRRRDGF